MTVPAITPLFVPAPPPAPRHRPPAPHRGLPLASITPRRTHGTMYGMAAMDCRGRIADQAVLRGLGWSPGTRTDVRASGGLVVVTAGAGGGGAVTKHGHLRLPATIRHRVGLLPGDRVLLAGRPAEALLIVYPPAALDDMLTGPAADLGGGPT